MKSKLIYLTLTLCLVFVRTRNLDAGVIGTLRVDNGVCCVGENASAYYGQSFVAPNGVLNKVTVLLASANGGVPHIPEPDHYFRILITETESFSVPGTRSTIRPTSVIFESSTQFLSDDRSNAFDRLQFTAFNLYLGELQLISGSTYAVVIDVFSEFDGQWDYMGSGLNSNAYAEGNFFYFAGTASNGNRQSHFASEDWGSFLESDLAFELDFTPNSLPPNPVPELASIIVWICGIAGIGRVTWRKKF